MVAEQLQSKPPGNIVLSIVLEWEKKEAVSVSKFSDIARDLGNLRVRDYLEDAYKRETRSPFPAFSDLNPDKDSVTSAI